MRDLRAPRVWRLDFEPRRFASVWVARYFFRSCCHLNCFRDVLPSRSPRLQNPENLLVFAAGNEGWFTDRDGLCTVNSPGIAKVQVASIITVNASRRGEARRVWNAGSLEPTKNKTRLLFSS